MKLDELITQLVKRGFDIELRVFNLCRDGKEQVVYSMEITKPAENCEIVKGSPEAVKSEISDSDESDWYFGRIDEIIHRDESGKEIRETKRIVVRDDVALTTVRMMKDHGWEYHGCIIDEDGKGIVWISLLFEKTIELDEYER